MGLGIRRGVAAGVGLAGFLGAGYLIYKNKSRLYVGSVAAAQVLIFGAATSAALISGKFIGFGPQLGLVTDRLTLITDLAFYTFVIGGCYAPLVVELVMRA